MNNIRKIAIFMLLVVAVFACKEGERYGISSDDKVPPHKPVLDSVIPLDGGARIFYTIPDDRDVISIEASFTATNGKLIKSARSFFAPYLEIFGLSDTLTVTHIQLYALDRAGNKSESVDVPVKPLEPAFSKVARTLTVKPAFGALMINWENNLEQSINVFVDFTYSDNGTQRSLRQAFSSLAPTERKFIEDLNLPESEAISVKVTVEDLYGNTSGAIDKGALHLLVDEELDKSKFVLPNAGDYMGGVVMAYGNSWEGRTTNLFDGKIDFIGSALANIAHFSLKPIINGVNVNAIPWSIFFDLGDRYELSRIRTNQCWTDKSPELMLPTDRGHFYQGENIGTYEMYYWDGDDLGQIGEWKLINRVTIPMPTADMSVTDIIRRGAAGDEAFMDPDNPGFTKATRFFRYKSISGFPNAYNGEGLSELTLYGRKATR
jgi:hypothetical protein